VWPMVKELEVRFISTGGQSTLRAGMFEVIVGDFEVVDTVSGTCRHSSVGRTSSPGAPYCPRRCFRAWDRAQVALWPEGGRGKIGSCGASDYPSPAVGALHHNFVSSCSSKRWRDR